MSPPAISDAIERAAAQAATAQDSGASAGDYLALLKPRVMSLVVFTGLVGLYLAPGALHPFLAFVAVLCIAVGAGASGAINMWYDRDIDAVMARTKSRPIPAGRVAPGSMPRQHRRIAQGRDRRSGIMPQAPANAARVGRFDSLHR